MTRPFLHALAGLALIAAAGCQPDRKATGSNPPPDGSQPAPQPDRPKAEPPEKKAGGRYEVSGMTGGATGGSAVSDSGNMLKNDPVEIEWAVGKEAFDKLREGMTLEEARKVLGLSALSFTPHGEASELRLVCKKGGVTVTVVFAGFPEAKLKSKSAEGFK